MAEDIVQKIEIIINLYILYLVIALNEVTH